ncbi:MAG: hypothetical protein ACOCRZ_04250 [Halothermotrichaceae bacterium]
MSDILKHILVGDMLGKASANSHNRLAGNIVTAFSLGVVSHAVMDMVEPDYTINWFNKTEISRDIPYLLFQLSGISLFALITRKEKKRNSSYVYLLRIAAIIGAIIPDIIDGIYSIINPSAWYTGQLIFPWHRARTNQAHELMSMWSTMLLTCVFFICNYISIPLYRLLLKKSKSI